MKRREFSTHLMASAVGVPVPNQRMAIGKMAMGAIGRKLSMIGSRFSRMAGLEPDHIDVA